MQTESDADQGEFISKFMGFITEVEQEILLRHFTYTELEEKDRDVKKLRNRPKENVTKTGRYF